MNQISCEYAHLHIMSFTTTKFYDIMLSGFRGVALTRKQDCLTDWLTDVRFKNIIPSVTPCVGFNYWPLINCLGDCFNQCIHEEWKTGSSWTSSHQARGFSAEHNADADCLKVKPERTNTFTNTFTLCILWYFREYCIVLTYDLVIHSTLFIYIDVVPYYF